jgi:hypothetical protein
MKNFLSFAPKLAIRLNTWAAIKPDRRGYQKQLSVVWQKRLPNSIFGTSPHTTGFQALHLSSFPKMKKILSFVPELTVHSNA